VIDKVVDEAFPQKQI
jgi:hypothetical protein